MYVEPYLFFDGRCEGADRFSRKNIELCGFRRLEAFKLFACDIGRNDARALRDEGLGNRPADSLAGGRDQRQLSLQSVAHGNYAFQ